MSKCLNVLLNVHNSCTASGMRVVDSTPRIVSWKIAFFSCCSYLNSSDMWCPMDSWLLKEYHDLLRSQYSPTQSQLSSTAGTSSSETSGATDTPPLTPSYVNCAQRQADPMSTLVDKRFKTHHTCEYQEWLRTQNSPTQSQRSSLASSSSEQSGVTDTPPLTPSHATLDKGSKNHQKTTYLLKEYQDLLRPRPTQSDRSSLSHKGSSEQSGATDTPPLTPSHPRPLAESTSISLDKVKARVPKSAKKENVKPRPLCLDFLNGKCTQLRSQCRSELVWRREKLSLPTDPHPSSFPILLMTPCL